MIAFADLSILFLKRSLIGRLYGGTSLISRLGRGLGGGGWCFDVCLILKLLKSSVIATLSTISEVGTGSPSLVALHLTNGVIGLCSGSLSEFLSLGLRRFLSYFFVFTWVTRPYSV